jgi:hypothetical protein
MNIADLQDDDYDDYDDYGDEIVPMPSTLSGYSQQPQPDAAAGYTASNIPSAPYSPPEQTGISYLPTPYQPEQASASYPNPTGGSSYDSGGLGNMSSMGSSLPSASPPVQTSKYGGGDKCPRCGKTVYFAEAKEGPNNIKYHK